VREVSAWICRVPPPQAINDWLADGLAGRAPKTVSTQREVLEPLIGIIGAVPLRELTAATVRSALKDPATTETPTHSQGWNNALYRF
jgi:hypothetical protein